MFIIDGFGYSIRGCLTTEHAASSYGIPVFVGADGNAYGPGDVFGGQLYLEAGENDQQHAGEQGGFEAVPNSTYAEAASK